MGSDFFPVGKLPLDLLERLLTGVGEGDPNVLAGPGVGVDASVIRFGSETLVFKTDPITFTSGDLPWYLVTINSNDIACMGGTPRYLLATFLLPEGRTSRAAVENLFAEMKTACSAFGITLAGGHTEITHGLDRPIAIGFMIGTLDGRDFIRPSGARPGNAVLLSKRIPIEATAVVAAEKGEGLGLDTATLERAKALVKDPGISILEEARIARDFGGVTAMHDPTEGGLATGLKELAHASGFGMRIERDRIRVLDLAEKILPRFSIDPLGALASGSLLVCCERDRAEGILKAWADRGIEGALIGEVTEGPETVLLEGGTVRALPEFGTDEITRIFSQAQPS
ncbi:MAG TPA: AIR synthase-related protein [Deltaproteobacteria bacterium]|jgi:hydrogenase maturation factor|nr:AIR synthase-related protein [Deltaproteobacteria bacterium]HOI07235.1 AIR synthase-related protein [Deltaproteobacteria bacterium]